MSHQHALAEAFKKIKEKQGEGYKIGTLTLSFLRAAFRLQLHSLSQPRQ